MREGGKPSICSFRSHGLRDAEWRGGRGRQRGGRSSPARVVMDDQTRGVSTTESANREEVAAARQVVIESCGKCEADCVARRPTSLFARDSESRLAPRFARFGSSQVPLPFLPPGLSISSCPADICYLRLTLFERQVRLRKFTKVYNSSIIGALLAGTPHFDSPPRLGTPPGVWAPHRATPPKEQRCLSLGQSSSGRDFPVRPFKKLTTTRLCRMGSQAEYRRIEQGLERKAQEWGRLVNGTPPG